ncbi:MAG: hypothetical protein ACNI26_14480 [Terasakiella sp.]|uniref:hypothetical protein n=1 Tax=unclassified Terasakiella TaxID=2614952 RepID=UPI003B00D8DB
MPLIATSPDNITERILAGDDLWVRLKNRFGEQKYLESYRLTSIFGRGDLFYARFRHVHRADAHIYHSQQAIRGRCGVSYGYNNFSNVVSTSSIEDNFVRLYSAYAYDSIEFFTSSPSVEVWNSEDGGSCDRVYDAVWSGKELKLKVELKSGNYFILPIHTLEAFADKKGFRGDTEIDGFAHSMVNFDWLQGVGRDMDANNLEHQDEEIYYSSSTYNVDVQFLGLHFEVTPEKLVEYYMPECLKMGLEADVLRYSIFCRE